MAPRYTLARRKARELLQRLGITAPPIPVERVAELAGAEIRYEPFTGDVSGMVHRGGSGSLALIGVNSLHSRERCRFTIAHEIGHLLLHADEAFHLDSRFLIAFRNSTSSLAVSSKEIEANQFAAALLMPADLIAADLAQTEIDCESDEAIAELARRYEVSTQAMAIRISSLGVGR